ncbi:MAG: type II 3-dehydroquinate dehydratase [Proteobacteria bacterium]|nr:type II 3-dehydroquinate dehydratase [Pseudomonadota bacterium]
MAILIASGVNLDLLGRREPAIYGHKTLKDMQVLLTKNWAGLAKQYGFLRGKIVFYQTNSESELLAKISEPWHGIVLNPGAWTHTSLALADRLAGLGVPFVEVHVSNVHGREEIRKHSFCASHAVGVVTGFGIETYLLGLQGLLIALQENN